LAKDNSQPLSIRGGTWRIKEIEDQEGWPCHPSQGVNYRILEAAACGAGPILPQSGRQIPVTIRWQPTRLGAFGV
jgi:hypothetical protein